MTLELSKMGFGITGTVPQDIVRELAPRVEEAGFRSLWFNHAGEGDALASMQTAAEVTSRLRLISGVIPVDRVPVTSIVESVRNRDLPLDRVVIGIGASAKPSPLTTVLDAAAYLHEHLQAKVFVGALGPKMRRLAVRETEGVLLNWLTPEAARKAVADKMQDLADLPDKQAEISVYVRVAMGEASRPMLEQQAGHYATIPSYAANFKRLGFSALDAAVYGDTPAEIQQGIAPYVGAIDEVVVRAITPGDALDELLVLVEAVAG